MKQTKIYKSRTIRRNAEADQGIPSDVRAVLSPRTVAMLRKLEG